MKRSILFLSVVIALMLPTFCPIHAAECTIPNTFSAGTPAVADDVNANFDAVKTAVDDNYSRIATVEAALATLQAALAALESTVASQASTITALEATVASQDTMIGALQGSVSTLQGQVFTLEGENASLFASLAALESDVLDIQTADYSTEISNLDARVSTVEANTVLALDGVLTRGTDINGYDVAMFSRVNVQIVNGSGATDRAVNGTGNLVVGYNELRRTDDDRTGSHNIIRGRWNNYTSFGGLVAGIWNTTSGEYASISGGVGGIASGGMSNISGGVNNVASGDMSNISGGSDNVASGNMSNISGGRDNVASGHISSILGGSDNEAIASFVTIIGWNNVNGSTQADYGIYPYPLGVVWTRP